MRIIAKALTMANAPTMAIATFNLSDIEIQGPLLLLALPLQTAWTTDWLDRWT